MATSATTTTTNATSPNYLRHSNTRTDTSGCASRAQMKRGANAAQVQSMLRTLGIGGIGPLVCKLSVPPLALINVLQLEAGGGGMPPVLWVVGMDRVGLSRWEMR
eukprot:361363-Chlamydomonas_euryale.AAC.8